MPSSTNLTFLAHAAVNTLPPLLGGAETVGAIKFWDVGTGNCNTFYNRAGTALFYYDFGGNMGTGAQTYPYRADPLVADGKPAPAFDCAAGTMFVMSHWDNDHVYSLKAQPAVNARNWLGPREDIAPTTLKFVAQLGANLRIWHSATDAGTKVYATTGGVTVTLVRCRGNHLQSPSKRLTRNDAGIAMTATIETPTRAASAVKEIEGAVLAGANAAAAAGAGAAVAGNDVYKECVVAAANAASIAMPGFAPAVITAGKEGLRAAAVKGAARAAVAALDAPSALGAIFDATVAAAGQVDPGLEAMLRAMSASATHHPADAPAAATAGMAAATALQVRVAFSVLRAALQAATAYPAHAPGVVAAAQAAAGPLWAADPLVNPMIAAAHGQAVLLPLNAIGAFNAALVALPPGPAQLEVGRAALTSALNLPTDTATLGRRALTAAVTSLGALHPLLGRVLAPALAASAGGTATDVANALILGLDQAPAAACVKAVVAMKRVILAGGATNDTVQAAAGPTLTDDGLYANRVIKAARDRARALGAVQAPPAVLAAGIAALEDVPVLWRTRVLLTGDACFQAVPGLPATDEWDVLLAYHHGSRDGLTPAGAKPAGNHFVAPRAALQGHSTIVYSAGRRASGEYVHHHPEPVAITRYEASGWTRAVHTHPWGAAARGDRLFKLPYMP